MFSTVSCNCGKIRKTYFYLKYISTGIQYHIYIKTVKCIAYYDQKYNIQMFTPMPNSETVYSTVHINIQISNSPEIKKKKFSLVFLLLTV